MAGKIDYGAVRRLPSGNWQVRYRDPAGRRRAAPLTFKTRADAARWLAQQDVELSRGDWIDPELGDIPLAEWADRWMQSRADLRPKTAASYASLLRARILPVFGGRSLGSIRPLEVQEWV